MKKYIKLADILSIVFFFIFISGTFSQGNSPMHVPRPIFISPVTHELGIFLGGSYYVGDLNPGGHFNRFTRPALGGFYRINLNPRFSARAGVNYGTVEADDAFSRNEQNRNRNLSFKSRLLEFHALGEFNFLPFSLGSKKGAPVTPYVFLGLAVYKFNPLGYYNGTWHRLQPLSTEGQGTVLTNKKQYSLTQFSIPFGAGIKFNTSRRVGIGLEWGLRRTFTDYLDDVSGKYVNTILLFNERGAIAAALSDRSLVKEPLGNTGKQRGNSYNKDWYSFAGILITFKLGAKFERCDMPH